MKKIIASAALLLFFQQPTQACAWYDPDFEYFNLFTQTIIRDKSYVPFLLTYSNRFYDHQHFEIPDENIQNWQKFLNDRLSYAETKELVYKLPLSELIAFKSGRSSSQILGKLGQYRDHAEAVDYLIDAKRLEPYMRIDYRPSPQSFYSIDKEYARNATELDYEKTKDELIAQYHKSKNPEIKLRYAYQLVRLQHYTRNYSKAVQSFEDYVAPLNLKTAPYYWALDQMAGAQRGLRLNEEANWNFFQVFKNSTIRRESAFTSMKLSDSASFNNLLKRSQNAEDKNMAYFLLAYEDFSNPLSTMEKMYEIDPKSEMLKVLVAREINNLERAFLPTMYMEDATEHQPVDNHSKKHADQKPLEEEQSFWDKMMNFFRSIFSSDPKEIDRQRTKSKSDRDLLNHPDRIPFFNKNSPWYHAGPQTDYSEDLLRFTEKIQSKSEDEFWKIAHAYLKFLKGNHKESTEILSKINTKNPEYLTQIERMKMLNDIVSQPRIDAAYEDYLVREYPNFFNKEAENVPVRKQYYWEEPPGTEPFLIDVLANRYLLQGEHGKAFLMNNMLSDLQYSPNSKMVHSVEAFYHRPNKTAFEKRILERHAHSIGNVDAFFSVLHGDREMRLANFDKAKVHYGKAQKFTGIPRFDVIFNDQSQPQYKAIDYGDNYDGFDGISSLVFGHNRWVSYLSDEHETMQGEDLSGFSFIKNKMNKWELADAAQQLKKVANGNNAQAAKANQLLGNLLYNTSILGYYRHLFVMDIDNSNGGKYDFWNTDELVNRYYYKGFTYQPTIDPDNFDLAMNFYKKALNATSDREQKARILFQLASAEQGKYYQWEAKQKGPDYDDRNWYEKRQAFENKNLQAKRENFRHYFAELAKHYNDTQTAEVLRVSCRYYDHYLKQN